MYLLKMFNYVQYWRVQKTHVSNGLKMEKKYQRNALCMEYSAWVNFKLKRIY